jgi:hypothetical protein
MVADDLQLASGRATQEHRNVDREDLVKRHACEFGIKERRCLERSRAAFDECLVAAYGHRDHLRRSVDSVDVPAYQTFRNQCHCHTMSAPDLENTIVGLDAHPIDRPAQSFGGRCQLASAGSARLDADAPIASRPPTALIEPVAAVETIVVRLSAQDAASVTSEHAILPRSASGPRGGALPHALRALRRGRR